jgi:hypothetical protein
VEGSIALIVGLWPGSMTMTGPLCDGALDLLGDGAELDGPRVGFDATWLSDGTGLAGVVGAATELEDSLLRAEVSAGPDAFDDPHAAAPAATHSPARTPARKRSP